MPVIPASGPMPVQRSQVLANYEDAVLLGPLPAGAQVAVTGLTAANLSTVLAEPNPHAKDIALMVMAAQPSRVGEPTCSTTNVTEYVTIVTVPARQTFHASYTQPLMAPSNPPQGMWCLVAANFTGGWAWVTLVGHMKQAAP